MTNTPEAPLSSQKHGHVCITNVRLERCDGEANIGFDIEWDGSWRDAHGSKRSNWDAVWVFIKFQTQERKVIASTSTLEADLDRGKPQALLDAVAAVWSGSGQPRQAKAAPQGTPAPQAKAQPPGPQEVAQFVASHPPPLPPFRGLPPPLPAPPEWLRGVIDVKAAEGRDGWVIRQEHRLGSGGAPNNDETAVEYISAHVTGPAESRQIQLSKPSPWQHAKMRGVVKKPVGATVTVSEDGLGVFVHRSESKVGEGRVELKDIFLLCNPGTADTNFAGKVSLWVFGIEMVLVPEGEYSAGDPAGPKGPNACFYDACAKSDAEDRTYRVTSEEEILVGDGGEGKRLFYDNSSSIGNLGDGASPVPEPFPKGFRAFYVMKNQITQAQYGDFVNTLSGHARTVRFSYWYGDYRYTIFMTQSGQRVTLRPDRACNWLSWMDGAAFACWAGLRPMTELEFEKACRGGLAAVAGEFAWGTTNIKQAQVIFGDEDRASSVSGNCAYGNFRFIGGDGGSGPLPGNVFGAGDVHGSYEITPEGRATFSVEGYDLDTVAPDMRERRGESYYGVLGLSGNLWEWCVTVGNAAGRDFTGEHGTGKLDGFGNPDTKALRWPALDTNGACVRGGSWYTASDQVRLADRSYGSGLEGYASRSHDFGFRCARTAPAPQPEPVKVAEPAKAV